MRKLARLLNFYSNQLDNIKLNYFHIFAFESKNMTPPPSQLNSSVLFSYKHLLISSCFLFVKKFLNDFILRGSLNERRKPMT